MDKRELPKIALGAWAWGNDGTFGGTLTEVELRLVFDAAMAAGLNLWDTAYVYGMGTLSDLRQIYASVYGSGSGKSGNCYV